MTEILAEQPLLHERFDQNQRDYDDITTLFAEMVDGHMRTPFEFAFDGRELYASDGGPLGPEFSKGLAEAESIAEWDPTMRFEIRRRSHDQEEYHDMLAMCRGELPNTMIVVRDFPPELRYAPKDVGGYNVSRQQAMLGVVAWDGHTMKLYSQSLDLSDREGLKAIFHSLGYEPLPGELLGQRMHKHLDASEQNFLVNKLVSVYDRTLQQRNGGQWHAGRPEFSGINTYDFVRAQHDIVQQAMVEKRSGRLDVYRIAALLNERYEANRQMSPGTILERYSSPFHDLNRELQEATFRANAIGLIFSACGLTVESDEEPGVSDQLREAGYGNKLSGPKKTEVMKCVHCPLCNRDGVDAKIEYKAKEKTITCSHCKKSKTYSN